MADSYYSDKLYFENSCYKKSLWQDILNGLTLKGKKRELMLKKGKTFTQLSRAIIVAARNGIPDPNGNFQLRTAIDKAKAAGIPNDNIERAIAKGAGTFGGDENNFEKIRYEGYGAGGVAIIVEALTDNRNRTAADLRLTFSKNGGNLGETGCVSWMFTQKGVVCLEGEIDEDLLLEACLEGDGESYELLDLDDTQTAEVFTDITNLENLNQVLQNRGFSVQELEWRWLPQNTIEIIDLEQARSLLKLIETLESLDDVQNVTANFEMAEDLIRLSLV